MTESLDVIIARLKAEQATPEDVATAVASKAAPDDPPATAYNCWDCDGVGTATHVVMRGLVGYYICNACDPTWRNES